MGDGDGELSALELDHLRRLLGSWGILADLSFSDLLLMVPASPGPTHRPPGRTGSGGVLAGLGEDGPGPEDAGAPDLVVVGQMRPNNRPTVVERDLVGQSVSGEEWAFTLASLRRGETVRGTLHHRESGEPLDVESVPVRCRSRVTASLVRMSSNTASRPNSVYEQRYLQLFDRFTVMVAESTFPFPGDEAATEDTPRVGDGVVVVDREGRVEFASPNALNAFHRMGVFSEPEGQRFTELGVEESAVEWALATGRPVVEEVERRPDVIVLVHCLPLLAGGQVTGAMILLRDVTDVRRLDRLLLSKDAAIREVHHRVKNNLQTISSLLSLQARRLEAGAGRVALREAERRVRSIALVHEILSRDPGDQVPFNEIVASLVRMAEDSVVSARPVVIHVSGDLGEVSAGIATPLSVILAELLQNAVAHAFLPGPRISPQDPVSGLFPDEATGSIRTGVDEATRGSAVLPGSTAPGNVWLELAATDGGDLTIEVRDDGCGFPDGFDIASTTSLGLSIVRDLVQSQLGGTITLSENLAVPGRGAVARIVLARP